MSDIILVQGSLNPESKTSLVVNEASLLLTQRKVDHEIIDLRKLDNQFCDGRSLSKYNDDMQEAYAKMDAARGYIWGMPVYCFSISGPLKNFIDITAGAMENKSSAIICNAGGNRSYMALGDLSRILAFEARVVTVQPAVYTTYEDFKEGELSNPAIAERLSVMIDALLKHLNLAG